MWSGNTSNSTIEETKSLKKQKGQFKIPETSCFQQNGEEMIPKIQRQSSMSKINGWKQRVTIFAIIFGLILLGVQIGRYLQQYQQKNVVSEDQRYGFHNPRKQHDWHLQLPWTVPLLGRPTKDKHFNFTPVTLQQTKEYQQKMLDIFMPYNDTSCIIGRFGSALDGGYLACENHFDKTEAVINLGIEGKDDFGCNFTTRFKVTNYQYDCTSSVAPICNTNQNRNHYENVCLSDRTQDVWGHKFSNLKDMIDSHNLKGKHITIKIDVQGAEWAGLRSLPVQYLDDIDQLVMEFHNPYLDVLYPAYWGNIDTLKSIDEKFISVNYHMNNCIFQKDLAHHAMLGFAIQVTFINRRLVTINKPTRSFKLHPLNAPIPLCQIQV